jgi:two-component system, OmpR family, sensor kinase
MNRQKPLLQWFVLGACLLGGLLGLVVLVGWLIGSESLCAIAGAPMDPTAATGLLLASVSTWLSCRHGQVRPGRAARVLAGTVVGLGALPLLRRLMEWALKASPILPHGIVLPELGEPAISTDLNLSLLGLSLLALDRRWIFARIGALFGPISVSFIALTMFRGAARGDPFVHSVNMPVGAGVAFTGLALAIILSRAEATGALRGPWPARYAFILGFACTVGARRLAEAARHETATRQFQGDASFATQAVHRRVERYVGILHSAAALFASHPALKRDEFRAYVAELNLRQNYPGLSHIAYATLLSTQELPSYVDRVRTEGFPEFEVWPNGEHPPTSSVSFIEPLDAKTRPVLGYDMASDPTRREAMNRARDTGRVAISGRVPFLQDAKPGFMIFVPVYHGIEPANVAERREHIRGFAVGSLQGQALFSDTLTPELSRRISLSIFDRDVAPDSLLYSDHSTDELPKNPSHESLRTLDIAGEHWKVELVALAGFDQDTASNAGLYVFAGGLLISLLAFLALRTQIRAREQAEESVATRDMFISVASHELKTPLTPLRLNAQSIVESALHHSMDQPSLLARARGIERSSKKLEAMIDRLLDVSRLSLGRLQLNLERVELRELLRSVIADMQVEITTSGSSVELAAPLPVVGHWDRFRLEQVFSNLVRNSLKFGRRRPIRVELEARDGIAFVRVRDQGIGIARADLERIFMRFERAVSEQHYGGFGLGLWISQQIVDRHGGAIRLESTVGKGSTFTVTLPLDGPDGT